MDPNSEGQGRGLVDPSLSLQAVVPPLGQESSRQVFEQWSHQSEHKNCDQRVLDYVQKDQHRASHQDIWNTTSGCSSKPREVSNHRLGFFGECKLRDRYQMNSFFCVGGANISDKVNVM